mmetsp:Transcript_112310/g.362673  ORF Transcript_112310/g.362673 Transcript_112310/m.362673 type:complete len:225 (-) Transcript_112310:210-884(-)
MDSAQLLCQRFAIELVLKAMVAVDVKTDVLVSSPRHGMPLLDDNVLWSLENGQHHCHLTCRHPGTTDRIRCPVIVAAELSQWHRVGWLIADLHTSDTLVRLVAERYHLECLQGLGKPPVLPVPGALRPLPPAAGGLPALAPRATVKVQHDLQAALLRPTNSPVDVLQAWSHIGLARGGTEDHPIAEGQPNRVQPTAADALKVGLGDVRLPVPLDHLCSLPLPAS